MMRKRQRVFRRARLGYLLEMDQDQIPMRITEMEKRKLLIIGPKNTVTTKRNAAMLGDHFNVKLLEFRNGNSAVRTSDILSTFRRTLWADVTLSHFATRHAFWAVLFSKILRRKSIVIAAGHEVAKVPEIDYGIMLNPVNGLVVKWILRTADRIFAVSEFTRRETLNYVSTDVNIRVVYGCNAIDCGYFEPNGKKADLVLTVGFIEHSNIRRKGFEAFIKAAEHLPDIRFALLGKTHDNSSHLLRSILPPNMTIGGDGDLLNWYQKAKVYCQLSYYESLGVCLIEAMSCGCVPVVTDRGALPEVAGEVGFYAPYGDPEATAGAIEKALRSDRGSLARQRARECFSVEARRKEFIQEIEDLLY